jgi:hypothetical protein
MLTSCSVWQLGVYAGPASKNRSLSANGLSDHQREAERRGDIYSFWFKRGAFVSFNVAMVIDAQK